MMISDTAPIGTAGLRLRESLVKAAVAKLDLTVLTDHLAEIGYDAVGVGELVGHIRRASALILPRVDPAREKRRDAFVDGLRRDLGARVGETAVAALDDAVLQLATAEDGYRRVLATLQACDIAKLAPDVRMSAVLHRAAEQHRYLDGETTAAIARQRFKLPQSLSLRDDHGRPVSPDGVLDALVSGVSATLIMEAYNSKWFVDDVIVVPGLPAVGEEQCYQAGSNEITARVWQLWRRTEERARFGDGRLVTRQGAELPTGTPKEVVRCYELESPSADWFNFAAQLRLNDISGQTFAEMIHERNVGSRVVSLDFGAALPPNDFLNLQEALALGQLSDTLGYPVEDDQDRIDGLRIVEWLRGFAVLSVLADKHLAPPPPGINPRLAVHTVADLTAALVRGGLGQPEAAIFIDQATFRRTSRDLFDAPLIQLADGAKLLFGPALFGHNPGGILLSVFANKEVAFTRKGRAFELRVVELFKSQAHDARSFKVNREGAEYEFDVVVPWGDYVFLFECKNRSLPGDHPVQAYHFAQEAHSHARQVRRLADALQRWPDILKAEFGRDLSTKTIVPCVLNNLPYARIGPLDGAYFYDWSALSRFFGSGQLNLKIALTFAGGEKRVHRMGTLPIWSSDKPAPEDLRVEIDTAVQLRVVRHHTRREHLTFGLDHTTLAMVPEFFREDVTPLTVADLAGLARQKVKRELDAAAKKARKSRQREKRDQRIARG